MDWAAFDLVVANGAVGQHPPRRRVPGLGRPRGDALGRPVVNSPATLRWNLDKRYLRDARRGRRPHRADDVGGADAGGRRSSDVALPDGRDRRQAVDLRRRVPDGALRGRTSTSAARPHVADLTASGRVGHGAAATSVPSTPRARSGLIFLGGAFSHAIHKDPMIRPGAGRVDEPDRQPGRDARRRRRRPSSTSAARPWRPPSTSSAPPRYARVDMVAGDDGRPAAARARAARPGAVLRHRPRRRGAFRRRPGPRARLLPPPRPGSATGVTGGGLSPGSAPLPRRARPPGS